MRKDPGDGDGNGGGVARFFPVLEWLPNYDRSWLKSDLLAAITVAAFAVPNLMAFSLLAGLPPQYGLYAGIGAGIGYFLFGTVKRLNVGPSAPMAILVASVLGGLAAGDPERYLSLAVFTSLLVGLIFLLARVARLGFIINLIPLPVFKGFFAGVGLTIIASQLPMLLGIEGVSGNFFATVDHVIRHVDQTDLWTLGVGLLLAAVLVVLDWRFKRLPNPLIVVVLSIAMMSLTGLPDQGVLTVGDVYDLPSGIPAPTVPDVSVSDVRALLPLAFGLFLLSFVESTTVGRALESKHRYKMDPDQELVALGASNLLSGLLRGFPVSASVSRSVLNDHAGARTQLSSLLWALLLAVVAIGLVFVFEHMPLVILSVLVIVAVARVIDWKELHRIRMIDRTAFLIALASFVSVLAFGVLEGVAIGVLISFIYVIYRISTPPMVVLGRVAGTNEFHNVERHPENVTYPDILVLRIDAPLVFANSHIVKHHLLDAVEEAPDVKLVVLDMESSPMLDITASDMLGDLDEELHERGITFRLANLMGEGRDILRATYPAKRVGHIEATTTVHGIVDDWLKGGTGEHGSGPEATGEDGEA